MIRSRDALVLPLALMLLLGGLPADAQTAASPHRREAHGQMMQRKLGLNAEQAQRLKAIRESSSEQARPLHEQARQKRRELMQYLKSPDASEAKAMQLNGELNDIQRRLAELRLKTWFEMREHLSPEQLRKMEQHRRSGGPGKGP